MDGDKITLEMLKSDIDRIEHIEIKEIKDDVVDIKLNLNENNILTEQSIKSNEKLSNAIDVMKDTMIEITQNIKDSNRISSELTETVMNLNEKVNGIEVSVKTRIDEVDSKIDYLDNKSKFDILTWLKNNWVSALLAIGAVSYIISQLIANK